MDRARHDLLADAALALDQHRHVGVGDLLEQLADLLARCRSPRTFQRWCPRDRGQRGAAAPSRFAGPACSKAFAMVSSSSSLRRACSGSRSRRAASPRRSCGLAHHREHHHRDLRVQGADPAQRLETVDVGHHHVEEHHVGGAPPSSSAKRTMAVLGGIDLVSPATREGWPDSCECPRRRRRRESGASRSLRRTPFGDGRGGGEAQGGGEAIRQTGGGLGQHGISLGSSIRVVSRFGEQCACQPGKLAGRDLDLDMKVQDGPREPRMAQLGDLLPRASVHAVPTPLRERARGDTLFNALLWGFGPGLPTNGKQTATRGRV